MSTPASRGSTGPLAAVFSTVLEVPALSLAVATSRHLPVADG